MVIKRGGQNKRTKMQGGDDGATAKEKDCDTKDDGTRRLCVAAASAGTKWACSGCGKSQKCREYIDR